MILLLGEVRDGRPNKEDGSTIEISKEIMQGIAEKMVT
jgi:hypothetical protein